MKKNRMMRLASILLVCVLLTTSVISGTFAKYTTSATSTDTARVAKWGFNNAATINITNLFNSVYDKNVSGNADVIAPGTTNSASFQFTYDESVATAPEVAYTFTVSVDDSTCSQEIANNPNIKWALFHAKDANNITWTDWGTMLNNIKALSGDATGSKQYAAGELPTAFTGDDDTYYVAWKWVFDETVDSNFSNNDINDTAMGNAATASVTLKITINATQVD